MDVAMSDPPPGPSPRQFITPFRLKRITTCLTVTAMSGASFDLGYGGNEIWFSGLTGRKNYAHVSTLRNAKAAFKAKHVPWKGTS
jgi:hypothetical protein